MPVLWHREKLMRLPKPILTRVASHVFGLGRRRDVGTLPKEDLVRNLVEIQRRHETPLVWSRTHLRSMTLNDLARLASGYFGLGTYPRVRKLGRKRLISAILNIQDGRAPNPPGALDLAILALYAARTLMNPPLQGHSVGPWETEAVEEWASNNEAIYDYLVTTVTRGRHPGDIPKKTVPAIAEALGDLTWERAREALASGLDSYWWDLLVGALERVDWKAAAQGWAGFTAKPKVKALEPHLGFQNQPTWLVYTMFHGRPDLEEQLRTGIQGILFTLSMETHDVQSVKGYVGRRLEGWLQSALHDMIHAMKPGVQEPCRSLLFAAVRHLDYYGLANLWMEAYAGIS